MKTYPINMRIPGAHLQMVINQCTNFQKKKHASISPNMRGQNHVPTYGGQTERQTDRVKPIYSPHPKTSFAEGIIIGIVGLFCLCTSSEGTYHHQFGKCICF